VVGLVFVCACGVDIVIVLISFIVVLSLVCALFVYFRVV